LVKLLDFYQVVEKVKMLLEVQQQAPFLQAIAYLWYYHFFSHHCLYMGVRIVKYQSRGLYAQ
jgi:hypothetical protein